MGAKEQYQAGKLKEAIAAATEEVKARPADVSRRRFLCELLLFAGEIERADQQLDAASQLDPSQAVGIALLRQLLRAEQARRDFYVAGRLPEFLDQPAPEMRLRLEASIRIREGKTAEAVELLAKAEAQGRPISGTCDGERFEGLRDLDDLTASFFEVLTSTGKYYWIPFEKVETLEFQAPVQPQNLYWRCARMSVRGGPDGEVYLPVLYHGSHQGPDDRIRLGRATEWKGGDGAPSRGAGQRMYLIGDRDLSILELKSLEIAGSGGAGD